MEALRFHSANQNMFCSPQGLQGELVAAQKDDEYVRKKLKLLEDEKIHLRHKYSDDEDEFRRKYGEYGCQKRLLKTG